MRLQQHEFARDLVTRDASTKISAAIRCGCRIVHSVRVPCIDLHRVPSRLTYRPAPAGDHLARFRWGQALPESPDLRFFCEKMAIGMMVASAHSSRAARIPRNSALALMGACIAPC